MYSKVIKCVSVAALALAAAVTLKGIPQILLQFAVCGGALFVMIEAVRNAKYLWAMAFAIPAALWNPVFPIELSRTMALLTTFVCGLAFLASLRYLHPVPKMSLATITDLPARGESL